MTAFIPGLIVGVILSAFALGLLCILLVLHRPATAPTFRYRRKWRDAPGTEFQHIPPTVKWEAKATSDERGVNYSFMGTTGLEE